MFSSDTTQVSDGGYQISRSLRFNSADSTNLNRTLTTATNRNIWTWSGWLKRSVLDSSFQCIFSSSDGAIGNDFFGYNQTVFRLAFFGGTYVLQSSSSYRDPSAFYHVVIATDTTQATSTNRAKVYINGVQVTAWATETYPPQNYSSSINGPYSHQIGAILNSSYNNMMLTEVNFIDGQQLTPSSFGETNAQTGVWQPKAFAGTYGTNGFYLNFSDNSNTTAATLGKDYSGNGNNWTPNNFSVTAGAGNDSLVDSPTSYGTDTGAGGTVRGNYCTLNPLAVDASALPTITNGNLDISANGVLATISMPTGTWYWEVTCTSLDADQAVGAYSTSETGKTSISGVSNPTYGFIYQANGNARQNGTVVQTWSTFTNNDILSFTYDASIYQLKAYKNNSLVGTITLTTPPSGDSYVPMATCLGGSFTFNFGQRPFAYTAPSGFKTLCTQNLPTPTIGATTATTADKYFNVVLRNGTSPSGGTFSTTVNMANGALLWEKPRSNADAHLLVDSVRGISKYLSSNTTGAEGTDVNDFTAFGTNSFTVGSSDWPTDRTIVDWTWAANGSGSTNTSGSITSTVSANTTSGFSVVTYTGSGVAATIGHGLGVAPSMIIVKSRSAAGDWPVYHSSLGNSSSLLLNSGNGSSASSTIWNATSPTSSVFSVGINTTSNTVTVTYVAYCFAEVAGYSKFGSYTGNGSANGPFVFTGMRPAYILIKCFSITGNSWAIYDTTRSTFNVASLELEANSSAAEYNRAAANMDILSNGFKIRNTDGWHNANGESYIYMAFASSPFKFSLAR